MLLESMLRPADKKTSFLLEHLKGLKDLFTQCHIKAVYKKQFGYGCHILITVSHNWKKQNKNIVDALKPI